MLRRKYSKLLLGIATAISLSAIPFITTNQNVFAAEGDEEIVAQNEDDFITQLQSGQIFISGLSNNDFTKVVIPSEIDGKPVTKINENAFRDKTKIKEVVIPDSVTNIGTDAFYNCNSLSELTIPVDVTAYNAFDYCRAIKKITYTKGLNDGKMPDADDSNDGNGQYYAFTPAWRSSSLTEVVFSDGITHIGDMAMRDQTKLTSVTMPNNEVSVGTLAFYRCYAIENIDTSKITKYSDRSFEECDNLASVSFNEKVTEIPDRTFYSCDKLDNLVIPDNIRAIGTDAFYYNVALTNLTIPVDVTAYNAFAYCGAIQKITYTKGLNDGKMPDADDSNDGNKQYYAFTPAYRSSSLTEVVFSDGITHIGDMAMRDQTKLTSVTMPNNEVSVGTLAFYRCYSITNIDTSNIIEYSARSFEECDNLASVSFNEKVTEIPDRTFYSCDKLDNLVIPDKIRTIGTDAFYYNVALTNLTIPVDVTAYNAFGYCGAIKKITYTTGATGIMTDADESNDGNGQYYPFTPANRSDNLETIILSDGITHIGDNAFRNHGSTLVNVTFPSNEYSVGYAAFYQDYALSISDEDISKATSIGAYAFQQCSGLETVSINSKVTEIPLNAFYGCAGIKTLIIPDSVKNIGDNAFRECTGITEVTIPVDVKARDSFYYCINIATINYTPGDTGEMIDFVYSGGTYNHTASIAMRTNSLTTVNFSDGVTHIGDNCLRERAGLTQVRFPNNEFSVGGAAFYQDTALVVEDKDIAKVTKLGDYAFYGCGGLTNLEFNSKLEKIPSYAFENCTGIETLSIPDNVTELGGRAFNGCVNIKEISIPIDINYTDNTFSEYNLVNKVIYTKGQDGDGSHSTGYNVASSLQKKTDNNQTVIFAEGVNYVAGSMFNDNCNKSITNVRFPKTLNGIGANAFVKGIDAVFYGYKGTDAEKYVNNAEDNTLSFRLLEYPLFNEGGCPGETELGKEEQYSAFVYTDIDETSDAIEWSVSDKLSSKTSIDQTGKLTVGDNEASREIHVYAQYGQYIVDVPVKINRTVSIVQFNAGNGTASEEAMVVTDDKNLASLPTAVYDNFTFDGWFTDEKAGEKVTLETTFDDDAVLYAHYSETPVKSIEINASAQPKSGEVLSTAVKSVSDNVEADSVKVVYMANNKEVSGTAKCLTSYSAKISFKLKNGFVTSDKTIVKIAGNAVQISESDSGSYVAVVDYKATTHGAAVLKGAETATKTKEGYTGDKCCSVCNEILERGKVIAKLSDDKKADGKSAGAGVGTISADGKTLTDTEGKKYFVNEKLTSKQLKNKLMVADKKSGGKFKITKVTKDKKTKKINGGNVTYMAPYNKNCKKAGMPKTVKIGGVKFKVTALNANAFKNCKKLQTVTIEANVAKIGNNAFNGCSSLKTIAIRTTKLKSFGTNTFKGISKKAVFKVPKASFTKYKKLINKAKAPKTAKITK